MKRKNPFWTRAQDFAVVALSESGKTCAEIGSVMNLSRSAVIGRLWRMRRNGIYGRILAELGIEQLIPAMTPPTPPTINDIPNDRICAKPDCRLTRQPAKPFCASHTELPARKRADMAVGSKVGMSSLGDI